MAQNYFEKALADEGLVGTPLESLARSIYHQESRSGKNTGVSSAGARGPMQVMPGTFDEMLPGGNINDPYQNTLAGLRYIKKMYDKSGGDLNLTAVGYYGGPGGMSKAKQGVAVGVPTDKNAPDTLQYAKEVLGRTNKQPVSRETLDAPDEVRSNIADLGQSYQAAYALANMADDETPETKKRREEEDERESSAAAAQQFGKIKEMLAAAGQVKSPFPKRMKGGGEATSAESDLQRFLDDLPKGMDRDSFNVSVQTPNAPSVVEGVGWMPTPQGAQTRVGYEGDNFRAGASGMVMKTPDGVKVMPGMYDVGYRMPMGGGELDISYMRGMKSMPGGKAPEMANVRYVKKFEDGGEAKAAGTTYGGPEKWIAEKVGLGPAYETSIKAPEEMGFSNQAGTQGDAIRHMVLMREIEKKYGSLPARAIGWGHEYIIGGLSEQPSRDREMDLRNNALGLELSKQAGGDEEKFRQLMRDALANKQADYYREEYTKYTKPKRRANGSPEEGEVAEPSLRETAATMLASLKNPEHWRELGEGAKRAAKAAPGVVESVARGAIATVPGTPGDIESLIRLATGGKQVMPTTEEILKKTDKYRAFSKPEGAEDLETMGGYLSPAAGPAAAKAGKGVARAALQDLDLAMSGQGGSKVAQALTSQIQPSFAVRPKGGVYLGAQSAKDAPLTFLDVDIKEALEGIDTSTEHGKAVADFIDKKVRKYYHTNYGTPDDPVFKGILEGRIQSTGEFRPELLQRARQGDKEAYIELRKLYDQNLGLKTVFPEASLKGTGKYNFERIDEIYNQFKEAIQKQKPGEPTTMDIKSLGSEDARKWPGLYDSPGLNQMIKEAESSKLMSLLNKTDLPPHIRQAARNAEPVTYSWYGESNANRLPQLVDIKDYLSTRTPSEIKNMGYADVVAKTQEWHNMLEQARKDPNKFSKKQLYAGTEPYMNASNDMKWVDVKSSDALSLEGNIMGHCVGGSNYCSAVDEGTKKIISLRDKKGIPHVTIELAADSKNGVFDRVVQVKGTANKEPTKYFPQIDEFLKEYQSKLGGTKLRITEGDYFLPEAWREHGISRPSFRRVDDRGAWVRYQNPQGEEIEEYVLRGDPRFQDLDFPDVD